MEGIIKNLARLDLNAVGRQDCEDQKRAIIDGLRAIPDNFNIRSIDSIGEEDIEAFNRQLNNVRSVVADLFTRFGKNGSINCGTNFHSYSAIRRSAHDLCQEVDDGKNYAIVLKYILAPIFALPPCEIIKDLEKQTGKKTFSKMCLNLAVKLTLDKLSFVEGYWAKAQKVNFPDTY